MNKMDAKQEWLQRPERSNRVLLKFLVWVALRLGRPAARSLLYPISLYYLLFLPFSRKASWTFLHHALGRPPRFADLYWHLFCFAASALDRVFLLNEQLHLFDVRAEGEDILRDILAQNRGGILLGAHFGSFEIIRALGKSQAAVSLSLLMYQENARMFAEIINAINPALATEVIALGQRDSMLKVSDRLEHGALVGMLADRTLEGEEKALCSFLDRPAAFPLGPFRLARILRRPVILMVGIYRGGCRYDVHFEMLAAGGEEQPPVVEVLEHYVARLEHYVRLAPYNWFNFYDFWKQ